EDRRRGRQVDPEGLLAEQVLARTDDVDVDLLVQVVGQGAVDRVDVGALEEIGVLARRDLDRGEVLLVPAEEPGVGVADPGQHGLEVQVEQVAPARDGGRELAPHQAAADDAEAYFPHVSSLPGARGRMPGAYSFT